MDHSANNVVFRVSSTHLKASFKPMRVQTYWGHVFGLTLEGLQGTKSNPSLLDVRHESASRVYTSIVKLYQRVKCMIDILVKMSKQKPTTSTKDVSSPKKTQEIRKQFIQFSHDDII